MCIALKATFEVTLTTPERLSMKQLGKTHNTTTSVTISPFAARYAQVTFTFTFDFSLVALSNNNSNSSIPSINNLTLALTFFLYLITHFTMHFYFFKILFRPSFY